MSDPDSIARLLIDNSKFYDIFKKQYFEHALEDAHDRGQIISNDGQEIIFVDSSSLTVVDDGIIIEGQPIEFGTFI